MPSDFLLCSAKHTHTHTHTTQKGISKQTAGWLKTHFKPTPLHALQSVSSLSPLKGGRDTSSTRLTHIHTHTHKLGHEHKEHTFSACLLLSVSPSVSLSLSSFVLDASLLKDAKQNSACRKKLIDRPH